MSSITFNSSGIFSTRLPFFRPSALCFQSRIPHLTYNAYVERPRSNAQLNRSFTQGTWLAYPRKDSQDKDSMNTEATEYSKSGTDDAAARQEDAAFDPDKTDPEEQKDTAGEGIEGNPLEVSPANPDVSEQRGGTEGGAESSSSSSGGDNERKRTSGGGSPNKAGKPT